MFTGIVEEIGTVQAVRRGAKSSTLVIGGKLIFEDLKLGDSIAVSGVCLTVTDISKEAFTADVMHETLERSSLGALKRGCYVNLERAMHSNGRFGGHIVSGHIDDIGTIAKIRKDDNAIWYTVTATPELLHYIVEKGSITIDGISLTVATITNQDFSVSIIPHTAGATTLSEKKIGDKVNLENDVVSKYIEKLMFKPDKQQVKSKITTEFLTKFGY